MLIKIGFLIQDLKNFLEKITFDIQLNFNHHISKICKTASYKLHALARVSHYINEGKKIILNAFNLYLLS